MYTHTLSQAHTNDSLCCSMQFATTGARESVITLGLTSVIALNVTPAADTRDLQQARAGVAVGGSLRDFCASARRP